MHTNHIKWSFVLRLTAARGLLDAHTHTYTRQGMLSGSANRRTSVLFSLKSVIFLSRLDGNVPTDVTEGRSSLLHTVERVEARTDERTEQDRHASWACHPGHFHANLRQMQFEKPAGKKKKTVNSNRKFWAPGWKFDLRNYDWNLFIRHLLISVLAGGVSSVNTCKHNNAFWVSQRWDRDL